MVLVCRVFFFCCVSNHDFGGNVNDLKVRIYALNNSFALTLDNLTRKHEYVLVPRLEEKETNPHISGYVSHSSNLMLFSVAVLMLAVMLCLWFWCIIILFIDLCYAMLCFCMYLMLYDCITHLSQVLRMLAPH